MKNQALRIAAMLTLALLVPFFLIACGDTGEGLTRADVSEIVRSEIANGTRSLLRNRGSPVRRSNRSCRRSWTTSRNLSRNPPARRPEQMADGKMAGGLGRHQET